MNGVVRVAIVDDHELYATTLAETVGEPDDLEVVAVHVSADDAIAADWGDVDVAIVDHRLGHRTGVEVADALLPRWTHLRAVMLTASHDTAVLAEALDVGCTGFVTKAEPIEAVISAVRAAARGEPRITSDLYSRLVAGRSAEQRTGTIEVDADEGEVLAGVAAGRSLDRIAHDLGRPRGDVDEVVERLLRRTETANLLQLAVFAVRHGFGEPGD